MWVVFILVVLCLGYLKLTSNPYDKSNLRKSQGWEAYSQLAISGISLLIDGALLTGICYVILELCVYLIKLAFPSSVAAIPPGFVQSLFTHKLPYNFKAYEIMVFIFSFIHCANSKKEKDEWVRQFRKQDSIYNMIFNATDNSKLLRVTLKSRKVYIGVVESERFNSSNLDQITLIPFLSGHRDKDTLQMYIDHNYYNVYKENKMTDDMSSLSLFQIVIRMDEVESLSLFDISYYEDFQKKES